MDLDCIIWRHCWPSGLMVGGREIYSNHRNSKFYIPGTASSSPFPLRTSSSACSSRKSHLRSGSSLLGSSFCICLVPLETWKRLQFNKCSLKTYVTMKENTMVSIRVQIPMCRGVFEGGLPIKWKSKVSYLNWAQSIKESIFIRQSPKIILRVFLVFWLGRWRGGMNSTFIFCSTEEFNGKWT